MPAPSNTFVREGETWAIKFDGETCRIPASLIGLDYISVLLRYAGKQINALNLRAAGAAAVPVDPGKLRELQSGSDTKSAPILQTDWSLQPKLDQKARANYQKEIDTLNDQITFAQDTGNTYDVSKFEKEKLEIMRELTKHAGRPGRKDRPRLFANQEEQARCSVTHAIRAAFEKIRKTAPATALHLRNNIATGTTLTYRDCSIRWRT